VDKAIGAAIMHSYAIIGQHRGVLVGIKPKGNLTKENQAAAQAASMMPPALQPNV